MGRVWALPFPTPLHKCETADLKLKTIEYLHLCLARWWWLRPEQFFCHLNPPSKLDNPRNSCREWRIFWGGCLHLHPLHTRNGHPSNPSMNVFYHSPKCLVCKQDFQLQRNTDVRHYQPNIQDSSKINFLVWMNM